MKDTKDIKEERGTTVAFEIDKDTKRVQSLADYNLYDNGNRVYTEGFKPFRVHHVAKPSGLVDGKYYPVVIRGAVNNQQVYINTRQSGGADPMNNASFDGIVRAMGWSDGISFAQGNFTIYQENERAIHSIMCNSESEGVYAFYVEARAFPIVVRVDSSCSVNAYNADRAEGTTTYKAGVTGDQIDNGEAVVKARRIANFDNGTGFYRTDGVRNSDSSKLQGNVNFDDYTTGRTYNLYGTSYGNNAPPFSYGTLQVIGRGNGSNTFVTQIATERGNRTTYIRTRNDNGVWTTWVKSYDEANKPTPAELGAVSLTADNGMTGILRIKNVAHNTVPAADECKYDGYGVIGNRGTVYLTNASTSSSAQVQIGVGAKHADAAKFIVYSNKVDTTVDLMERGKRVYSENNKPTAADVGALGVTATAAKANLVGNTNLNTTMTAYIEPPSLNWWGDCGVGHSQMVKTGNGYTGTGYVFKIGARDMAKGHAWIGLTSYDGGNLIFGANTSGSAAPVWATVYSTRNKPTAADVGAVNKAGDTMTGVLTVDANAAGVRITRTEYPGINLESRNLTTARTKLIEVNNSGHLNFITRDSSGANKGVVTLEAGKDGSIYHTGNKPSAADVGAMAKSCGGITNQDWNTLTTAGSYAVNNFSGANKPEIVGHPPVYTYGTLLVQNNGHTISQMYITDGNKIYLRDKYSSNGWGVWTAVANDESTVINTSVNLDDYSYGGTFNMYKGSGVTFTNAPSDFDYGTLQVIGRGRTGASFVTQILTWRNNGRQMIRTRNDGSFAWTSWRKIYSEVQKPTAAEVGALAIDSAGYVTTNVESRGNVLSMNSDATALHLWFKTAAGGEKALMWHDANAQMLQMRVSQSSYYVGVDGNGSVRSHTGGNIGAFRAMNQMRGNAAGIITGDAEAGAWVNWRERASAVQLDCANVDAGAVNIWKATKWAAWHVAAMDVHVPGNINEAQVSMHLGQSNNQFAFKANGQGFASAGWHTGSDARFKENIRSLDQTKLKIGESWLDKVCALNASSFEYKINEGKTSIGFIAQNVQEVIPEAISVQVDTTIPEEEREGTDRLFIDPMAIIAAQNQAIKELAEANKLMMARIEALEGK